LTKIGQRYETSRRREGGAQKTNRARAVTRGKEHVGKKRGVGQQHGKGEDGTRDGKTTGVVGYGMRGGGDLKKKRGWDGIY